MVDRTRWVGWADDARSSVDYAADQVKLDFAVDLERRMEQLGVSRAELARRLQTSAAAVTMALRGDANLTIERMVRMARALDATVRIHVEPAKGPGAGGSWTADVAKSGRTLLSLPNTVC